MDFLTVLTAVLGANMLTTLLVCGIVQVVRKNDVDITVFICVVMPIAFFLFGIVSIGLP